MPDPATIMMGAQLLGGFLGRRKKPNFQQILQRNQSLLQQQLGFSVQNLNQFGGQLMEGYQQMSPMFGQLAQGASQMYADDNRRQQLAQDMAKFTRANQAARGTLRSPAAALKESFAGLQFQEQMRQQDFSNLMAVERASPAQQIFGMMTANIRGDLGFQEMAARRQVDQANKALMMNTIMGMGNTYFQGQGLQQNQQFMDRMFGPMTSGSTGASSAGVPDLLARPAAPTPMGYYGPYSNQYSNQMQSLFSG